VYQNATDCVEIKRGRNVFRSSLPLLLWRSPSSELFCVHCTQNVTVVSPTPCHLNAFLENTDHMTNSYSVRKRTCKVSIRNFMLVSGRVGGAPRPQTIARGNPALSTSQLSHLEIGYKMNTCQQKENQPGSIFFVGVGGWIILLSWECSPMKLLTNL
jgi:hypothetical protein